MTRARHAAAMLAALVLGAGRAAGCEVPATAPVPLWLDDPAHPTAIVMLPALWAAGDPAALLADGSAFRLGCAHRIAALLLGEGMLVLAHAEPAPGQGDARVEAALAALHAGFGAGRVMLVWPADTLSRSLRAAAHGPP